jgi:hypothetical protein
MTRVQNNGLERRLVGARRPPRSNSSLSDGRERSAPEGTLIGSQQLIGPRQPAPESWSRHPGVAEVAEHSKSARDSRRTR